MGCVYDMWCHDGGVIGCVYGIWCHDGGVIGCVYGMWCHDGDVIMVCGVVMGCDRVCIWYVVS